MNFKNIQMSYMDGRPDGVRVCKMRGAPIEAVVIPRPLMGAARKLGEEVRRHCVYFLVGREHDNDTMLKLYVGQSKNGIERLDDHKAKKSFWEVAVMFFGDAFHFDLEIISALEKAAIVGAEASKRYDTTENKIDPNYKPDVYLKDDVDRYYEIIRFFMGAFGYSLDPVDNIGPGQWHTKRNGIVAYGNRTPNGFEVLPGSQIDMASEKIQQSYLKLRQALLKSKDIETCSDGKYILRKVVTFNTPSGASDFVIGNATNGWLEWINDKGEPLDILRK